VFFVIGPLPEKTVHRIQDCVYRADALTVSVNCAMFIREDVWPPFFFTDFSGLPSHLPQRRIRGEIENWPVSSLSNLTAAPMVFRTWDTSVLSHS
jgi:hypothetical protein